MIYNRYTNILLYIPIKYCLYVLFVIINFFTFYFLFYLVSPTELQRLKEAFKRSSGSGSQTLSKSAFIQDVLCESVPPSVADWLFTACGGTSKGIAFKELVCGLVLLTKGTLDEKIK